MEKSLVAKRFSRRSWFLFVVFILLLLFTAEIFLRNYPSYLNNWNSTIRYQYDSLIGYRLVPDDNAFFAQQCLKTRNIRVNSKGFRGPEWGNEKGGIALLGDSFLEALQVPEGKDVSSLLWQMRGRRVINAGISGFGTVAALETYLNYVKEYHPDTVLLFYYSGNDLLNNSCELNLKTGSEFILPCACGERDEILSKITFGVPIPRKQGPDVLLWRGIRDFFTGKGREKEVEPWEIYRNPGSHERQDAAKITLEALMKFRDEVWRDSAIFLVVNVPPYLSVSPDGWEEVKREAGAEKIGKDFDLFWPELELIQMCGTLGIPLLDLSPVFIAYRNQTHLDYPYFYFPCNGHWNELGHRVAANEIQAWLKNHPESAVPEEAGN